MIKTKYTGVYYRDTKANDRIFYITYKLKGKMYRDKVGSSKEGVTAVFSSKLRAKKVSVDRLKEDAPMLQNQTMPIFSECFDLYAESLINERYKKNLQRNYRLHLEPEFGDLPLDDISTEMIENFKKRMKTKVSRITSRLYAPKSINDILNIINTVFNFMITNHNLKIPSPAHNKKLKREKIDNDRERYLDTDEIKKLWKVLDVSEDNKVENMRVFLAVSLSTGARLRSVLTITKADVNLKSDTITIKNHKSNRTYNGYLHPRYKQIIEDRLKKLSPIDYIVNGENKEPHESGIPKFFTPILNELFNYGLDKGDSKRRVVVHTIRHTFASQLAIQGTPIYTIMRLMDHADISQTIRYAKLSPDSARKSVFQLRI